MCVIGRLIGVPQRYASYHALQDQYLALSFEPGLSHPWRARNEARFLGMCFLIVIFGSPKRTMRTLPPSLASTADFFEAPGVVLGLL